jgi:WD40 repeat protein
LFDGKSGELLGEMKDESGFAHSGGVMALSYNSAGTQLITASADKTVKQWDIETRKCISTLTVGKDIADQQLGCLWAGKFALSLSLSGEINYIDLNSNAVTKVLRGHQKSVETMEVKSGKIYTSSFEGRSSIYDAESGDVDYFTGATHKGKILDTKISGETLISVDISNKILRTPLSSCEMGADCSSVPSNVTFFDVHSGSGIEIYCCDKALVMFKDGSEVYMKELNYSPNGCTISPCGTVLAVGAKEDPKLYLYDIEGNSIVQRQEVNLTAATTEINFSPDGKLLGAATTGRAIFLLDVDKSYKTVQHCWSTSSKSISCCFSPDSRYFAIAGIDTNIVVGDATKPMEPSIKILRAHPLGTITRVRWLDEKTIVSTGSDMQVRQHTLSI